MKRAASVRIPYPNKKAVTKFSKSINSKIYHHILDIYSSGEPTEDAINEAAHVFGELDPCSTVKKGSFKGATSLMLYCIVYGLAKVKNLDINNLKEIYSNIINYPNLDVNATCIREGCYTGISVLWFAVDCKQWELVDNLIEREADINATCTGESPNKGISVLWLAAYNEQWKLVDKLIQQAADINAICTGESPNKGISVLWFAVFNNQWELVDKLIEMKVDVNATCTGKSHFNGISVLWLALDNKKWELADKLIETKVDVNATCTGESPYKCISVLWLAVYHEQWKLVIKLIKNGANINITCVEEGSNKGRSILGLLKTYNFKNKDNLHSTNKDVFYLMVISIHLRCNQFDYPADVILTAEDKTILGNLKEKIKLYIKIFIPTSINFTDDNYYKKNNLNDLPEEIRKIIALEYIKKNLENYSLSQEYIDYFSAEITNYLFNISLEERSKVQEDLEKSLHLYELVLFSNILANLRDYKNTKSIHQVIFREQFLPAFEKAKLQNKEIAFMNSGQRLNLYANAKLYFNYALSQQLAESTIIEHNFSAIFNQYLCHNTF